MRTRFSVFVNEILHTAIKEEEFHWPEIEVFNFRVNQIIIFQYLTFKLSAFE